MGAAPYRNGQVLHSVSAAARLALTFNNSKLAAVEKSIYIYKLAVERAIALVPSAEVAWAAFSCRTDVLLRHETSSTPASTRPAPASCAWETGSESNFQPKKIVSIGPSVPISTVRAAPIWRTAADCQNTGSTVENSAIAAPYR